jgi:hypothetical protein
MRALIMIAAVVVSTTCSSERARARVTESDAVAIEAIQGQLLDTNRALLDMQKRTPPSAPAFACYGNASEATTELEGSVGILSALIGNAAVLQHEDDIVLSERFVASAANEVVNVAAATEAWVNRLEGNCDQDHLAVSKLDALLELIGKAKDFAASVKQRLPRLPT